MAIEIALDNTEVYLYPKWVVDHMVRKKRIRILNSIPIPMVTKKPSLERRMKGRIGGMSGSV
jgi:hypothetical protein